MSPTHADTIRALPQRDAVRDRESADTGARAQRVARLLCGHLMVREDDRAERTVSQAHAPRP